MEKREKKKDIIIFGIVMAISLSVALNIGNIFGGVGTFIKIVNPILLGCMIAIILNVPMEALSRVFEKMSGKVKFLKKEKTRNGISLVISIVGVVLIFGVIIWMIIPGLIESVSVFIKNFDTNLDSVTQLLNKYGDHLSLVRDYVDKIDWNNILKNVGNMLIAALNGVFTGLPQIGSSLFNLSISIIIAIYVIIDKKKILTQIDRLIEEEFTKKI